MTWLARVRTWSMVLGLTTSLLLAIVWAASAFWAAQWSGAVNAGVIVWKGSATWWQPSGRPISPAPWSFEFHTFERFGNPMIWWPRYADDGRTAWVTIPLWIPLALVAAPSLALLWGRFRYRRGCCRHCRYNLRGLSGDCCPECGEIKPLTRKRPVRRIAWTAAITLLAAAVCAQSLWTELTFYTGCVPTKDYSDGSQLSLCHGGLFWRSSVATPAHLFPGVSPNEVPILAPPPGRTGPEAAIFWKLRPTAIWWNEPYFDEVFFTVVFVPGWIFVAAAALLTWFAAGFLARKPAPPPGGTAP